MRERIWWPITSLLFFMAAIFQGAINSSQTVVIKNQQAEIQTLRNGLNRMHGNLRKNMPVWGLWDQEKQRNLTEEEAEELMKQLREGK